MDVRHIRAATDYVCTHFLFHNSVDIALDLQSIKGRLQRGFKALYPWLNTSFELWLLVYNIAYLFDQTPFYRPWLSWIGVDLRRLGVEDFVSFGFSPPRCVVDIRHSVQLKGAQCLTIDVGRLLDYDDCSSTHRISSWTHSNCCYQQPFSLSSSWSGGILLDHPPVLYPNRPWVLLSLPREFFYRMHRVFRLTTHNMGFVRSVRKVSTTLPHYPLVMSSATDVRMTRLRGTEGVQSRCCQLERGS